MLERLPAGRFDGGEPHQRDSKADDLRATWMFSDYSCSAVASLSLTDFEHDANRESELVVVVSADQR